MTDTNNPVMFIPIQKIDAKRHEVWGYGSREEGDQAKEIMDFESSEPYFQRWSDMTKVRSNGKSLGNVRAMHGNVAAGRLVAFNVDRPNKGFYVGAHVVDENEWKKVESGVYTGFSIGGSYVKRWPDAVNPGYIRYTADPKELSLVDSPCLPGATFDVVKADGALAKMAFHPEGKNRMEIMADDLEKVAVPAPVATMATGEKPQGPFHVEQVPNASVPLEIKAGSEPEQSVLQTHAVASKDVTSEIEALMPKIKQLVKDMVAEELRSLRMVKVVYSEAPAAKPAVTSRLIKVVRSEHE